MLRISKTSAPVYSFVSVGFPVAVMLHLGLCGTGVVGKGVLDLVGAQIQCNLEVKKIFTRSPHRLDGVQHHGEVVTSEKEILSDPSINCVVEVIGGTAISWDIVKTALLKGKHVVTANKALIARYLKEIISLIDDHPNVHFRYEAAVGGGLPIILLLQRYFAHDSITSFHAILNGTTNFILTQMAQKNLDFDKALSLAQEKGYAEANPHSDISGEDARFKTLILSNLCFGVTPDIEEVGCQGIQGISSIDFIYARSMKKIIKLIGSGQLHTVNDSTSLSLYVTPALVSEDSPLAKVDNSLNAVFIQSKNLGESFFMGEGAGRYPTAHAVVSDIKDICQCVAHQTAPAPPFRKPLYPFVSCTPDYTAEFYIRFSFLDQKDATENILKVLDNLSIRIKTHLPNIEESTKNFAIITTQCSSSLVYRCVKAFIDDDPDLRNIIKDTPVVLAIVQDRAV